MDLAPMTTRLLKGIKYEAVKDKYDHDFAKVEVKIGSLDNEPEQIEENLKTLVIDVENSKPKARSARCITLVNLYCANSREMFKIDHTQYLPPEDDVVSLKDTLKAQSPIV